MMNNNVIYKLWLIGSDRVYIGSAKNFRHRLTNHLKELLNNSHQNHFLSIAFRKYGIENFRWEVLEQIQGDNISKQLLERESYYIELYKSSIDGYNKASYTNNSRGNISHNNISILGTMEDYMEYINKFKSRYNVTIEQTMVGNLKNDDYRYTKRWFDLLSEDTMNGLVKNIYSSCCHHVKTTMKKQVVLLPAYKSNLVLKRIIDNTKLHKVVNKPYEEINMKYTITDVSVFGIFNPLHLEIGDMKKRGVLDVYRVYTMLRSLEDVNLDDNVKFYFPSSLYNIFEPYLK